MQHAYLKWAVAALSAAIIFPLYWINELDWNVATFEQSLMGNLTNLNVSDLWFFLSAALPAFVYLGLKHKLHNELNFKKLDVLIYIAVVTLMLFGLTVLFDISLAALGNNNAIVSTATLDLFVNICLFAFFASMLIMGLVDLIIGVILVRAAEIPTVLKIYGAVSIVQGICEFTLIFGLATLVTFPLLMILLALYFLKSPEQIEVV